MTAFYPENVDALKTISKVLKSFSEVEPPQQIFMFPVTRDKLKGIFKHGDVVLMRSDSIIYGIYKS